MKKIEHYGHEADNNEVFCMTCRFFQPWESETERLLEISEHATPVGTCQRYAPRPFNYQRNPDSYLYGQSDEDFTAWPVVDIYQFCGEWKMGRFGTSGISERWSWNEDEQ